MKVDKLWKGRLQTIIDTIGVTRPEDIEVARERFSQLEYGTMYSLLFILLN